MFNEANVRQHLKKSQKHTHELIQGARVSSEWGSADLYRKVERPAHLFTVFIRVPLHNSV